MVADFAKIDQAQKELRATSDDVFYFGGFKVSLVNVPLFTGQATEQDLFILVG